MSKSLISGKVLAVQLGREQSRIALVSGGAEVLHSVTVPTPAGAVEDGMIRNQEAVRKMLKTAVSAKEFKNTRKVVFCMATSQVISETVTVPDLPAQKMEKLLDANKDMYFPVDMKEYRMTWQVIGPKSREGSASEMIVQLWAVPEALTSKYYAVANACGLSVEAVDYYGNSVVTAAGASYSAPAKAKAKKQLSLNTELSFGKKKKEEAAPAAAAVAVEDQQVPDTDLYISLDPDLLGMTFVQNGQVMMQRFVQCGSDPAAQLDELAMMLEYFRSLDMGRGSEINANAVGALSDDRDLLSDLSDMLGVTVNRFASDKDPRWVLCVAAARTARDFGIPSLNKAGAARKQMGAELWQYVLVLAGGAVLVGVVLLTLSSRLVWNAEIKGLENTQQNLSIQAQKTAGYADNYKTYSALYDSYSADWETLYKSLRTPNDNLVLILKELEEILPDLTSVVQLQIGMDNMTVTLASDNKEEAAYVIMALREMQYADVAAISNLQGGGKGPAKTYGPKVEDAPTEGSSRAGNGEQSSIASLISQELNQEELMALAVTMTPEQFTLLEQAYGKQPETKYESIQKLKDDKDVSASYTQRSDAVNEMFTTNPFAVNHFVDALEKDLDRDEPILYWYVLEEMIVLENEGKLPSGGMDTPEGMQAYADVLVYILTKNETNLAAAEALFATDEYLETTYLHYLEVEMSLREAETLPFLNLDNVLKDLMNGSFNTTDPELDGKLNSLISEDAWNMMDQMNTEEEMEALLGKYLTDGTTGNAAMDALINEYLTTGTTGSDQLDKIIKDKLGDQVLDEQLGQMMQDYLQNGTTGNDSVDELISAYLTTGTTGNDQMDAIIKNYLGAGELDEEMLKLLEAYLKDGTTGNSVMDNLIKKYLTEGTSGNKHLDELVEGYIASGEVEDIVGDLVENYLTDGTTGNEVLDAMIQKFLNTGTTGNKAMDKLIENYINGGNVDAELADLIQKYFNDGTTGNKVLDSIIEKYLTEGTTGNKTLDKVIVNYINAGHLDDKFKSLLNKFLSTGTTGNPVLDNMVKKYIKEGTTGNVRLDKMIKDYLAGINLGGIGTGTGTGTGTGGGNYGGSVDTRIFFSVTLQYNEELIQAELARKGLDYSQKVQKVEVSQ